MRKRTICIINALLLIFCFLTNYAEICYRAAIPGHGRSNYSQYILTCHYFAFLVVMSIICIHKCYHKTKALILFTGIASSIMPVLYTGVYLFSFIIPSMGQPQSLNFFEWVMALLPPVICGLYFLAAYKKGVD